MDTRAAAATVIGQLLQQKGSLANLIPHYISKVSPQEQSLFQEMCFGTARWQPQLHCYLERLLEKPLRNKDQDIHALLLIGLYQLIYMRTPDHAVLHSTVAATKPLKKVWAKKFVNGVLRRFLREKDTLDESLSASKKTGDIFTFSHPKWFIDQIKAAWPDHFNAILTANNERSPLTLRINKKIISRGNYLKLLNENNVVAKKTRFSADGITLEKPTDVATLPLFLEGGFSVQDESPQFAAELLELEADFTILDACCAPGGKTAHILEQDLVYKKIVGLDVSEQRLQRTAENLSRLTLSESNIIELKAGDASEPDSWWDGEQFDRILLDAPCSATGIIRRQPDIKILRTADNVAKLVNIQTNILAALWPLLKPNGILLYATCSILPEENSQIIEAFLNNTPAAQHIPIEAEWGMEQANGYGRQLFPSSSHNPPETGNEETNDETKSNHDGFYYAKLRKNSE
ncbi:MAG: 16S rRNA (cytosine(967)-C(5))-methyltransferase RsmB [Cellvibrionaceae bacterium]